jgi:hypothetical protein
MTPPGSARHWLDHKYLFAWLQVATKGLSDESRARIRQEITDHFHEAVDEGVRAGLTEDAAAEQAVEGLGSPQAARRAFRRTYLTHWQANLVRSFTAVPKQASMSLGNAWIGRRRRVLLGTVMVIGVTAGTALEFLHDAREWPLLGGLAVVMMIATVVLATAVPRLFRRGRERAAIALGASAEITLWCAFLIAPAVRPTGSRELRLWFLAMVVVVMAATYLPLLRKLGTRRAST